MVYRLVRSRVGPWTFAAEEDEFGCLFYHDRCYTNFTNVFKINCAQKRRAEEEKSVGTVDGSLKSEEIRPPGSKRTRSCETLTGTSRNPHVLPELCIICRKKSYFRCKVSSSLGLHLYTVKTVDRQQSGSTGTAVRACFLVIQLLLAL